MHARRLPAPAALACLLFACAAPAQSAGEGEGIYLMGPGMPSVFTFDRESMSCSVSWGSMGAPGPGPFSEPAMGLEGVNFGMIVFSLGVDGFEAADGRVNMTGSARSITTVDDAIAENAVYRFTVEAVDGGPPGSDRFSMTLHGEGLMFHDHTFAPPEGEGLVAGDIVIGP